MLTVVLIIGSALILVAVIESLATKQSDKYPDEYFEEDEEDF